MIQPKVGTEPLKLNNDQFKRSRGMGKSFEENNVLERGATGTDIEQEEKALCYSRKQSESLLPGCRLQTSCYVLMRELDHKEGCVHAKSLQLCLTLCSPMHCNPPGSSFQEILQARILEWVAISFSRGSS